MYAPYEDNKVGMSLFHLSQNVQVARELELTSKTGDYDSASCYVVCEANERQQWPTSRTTITTQQLAGEV